MDEVTKKLIAEETDPKIKALLEYADAMVEHERKLRRRWESGLEELAKRWFETLLDVKPGDMMDYDFICVPKKVVYDGICMDKYGDLKVRCYHLKKDGTPRKNPSYERWGDFYTNEIKYKTQEK